MGQLSPHSARPTPAAISDNCQSQESTTCSKKCGKGIWESHFTVSPIRGISVIFISTSDDRMRLWTAFEGHISVEPLMCAWLHSVHFNPFLNCLANYIAYCLLHNASFLNANKISKSLKPDLQEQFGKRGKFLIFINQKPTYSYLSSSKIFDEEKTVTRFD